MIFGHAYLGAKNLVHLNGRRELAKFARAMPHASRPRALAPVARVSFDPLTDFRWWFDYPLVRE